MTKVVGERDRLHEEYAVRVLAPIDAVWQEIETIDLIVGKMTVISQASTDDLKQSAKIRARVAWGPFSRTLHGTATIVEAHKPDFIDFGVDIPDMHFVYSGRLELASVASEETNLRFALDVRLGLLARGVKSVVDDTVEGHVRSLVGTTAAMAERHWQAHQRLEHRDRTAEQP